MPDKNANTKPQTCENVKRTEEEPSSVSPMGKLHTGLENAERTPELLGALSAEWRRHCGNPEIRDLIESFMFLDCTPEEAETAFEMLRKYVSVERETFERWLAVDEKGNMGKVFVGYAPPDLATEWLVSHPENGTASANRLPMPCEEVDERILAAYDRLLDGGAPLSERIVEAAAGYFESSFPDDERRKRYLDVLLANGRSFAAATAMLRAVRRSWDESRVDGMLFKETASRIAASFPRPRHDGDDGNGNEKENEKRLFDMALGDLLECISRTEESEGRDMRPFTEGAFDVVFSSGCGASKFMSRFGLVQTMTEEEKVGLFMLALDDCDFAAVYGFLKGASDGRISLSRENEERVAKTAAEHAFRAASYDGVLCVLNAQAHGFLDVGAEAFLSLPTNEVFHVILDMSVIDWKHRGGKPVLLCGEAEFRFSSEPLNVVADEVFSRIGGRNGCGFFALASGMRLLGRASAEDFLNRFSRLVENGSANIESLIPMADSASHLSKAPIEFSRSAKKVFGEMVRDAALRCGDVSALEDMFKALARDVEFELEATVVAERALELASSGTDFVSLFSICFGRKDGKFFERVVEKMSSLYKNGELVPDGKTVNAAVHSLCNSPHIDDARPDAVRALLEFVSENIGMVKSVERVFGEILHLASGTGKSADFFLKKTIPGMFGGDSPMEGAKLGRMLSALNVLSNNKFGEKYASLFVEKILLSGIPLPSMSSAERWTFLSSAAGAENRETLASAVSALTESDYDGSASLFVVNRLLRMGNDRGMFGREWVGLLSAAATRFLRFGTTELWNASTSHEVALAALVLADREGVPDEALAAMEKALGRKRSSAALALLDYATPRMNGAPETGFYPDVVLKGLCEAFRGKSPMSESPAAVRNALQRLADGMESVADDLERTRLHLEFRRVVMRKACEKARAAGMSEADLYDEVSARACVRLEDAKRREDENLPNGEPDL